MIEPMTLVGALARGTLWAVLVVALLVTGPLVNLALGRAALHGDWSSATHRPAGYAPEPSTHAEAIVQVYAGRAFGWRGAFSDHTWIAVKPEGAERYTRYEVIGWYARHGGSAVAIGSARAPDAEWFGARPRLLRDLRGAQAQAVIDKLPAAVASYRYAYAYSAWPGPNSNTFVAHLAREIPELRVALPSTAIGKDYLPLGRVFARTPSGTGWQLSLGGLLGVAAGPDEGFELNVLGLVVGFDVRDPALKLPGIGRLPGSG